MSASDKGVDGSSKYLICLFCKLISSCRRLFKGCKIVTVKNNTKVHRIGTKDVPFDRFG